MTNEKTFFMLKPDAIERKLVLNILDDIVRANFYIEKCETRKLTCYDIDKLYPKQIIKDYYDSLVEYYTRKPVFIGIASKENAVKDMNILKGKDIDNPPKDSIRGKYGFEKKSEFGHHTENLIHSSGNKFDAEYEIRRFFGDKN